MRRAMRWAPYMIIIGAAAAATCSGQTEGVDASVVALRDVADVARADSGGPDGDDATLPDTTSPDTTSPDAGLPDTASPDTNPVDTDAGLADADTQDSGPSPCKPWGTSTGGCGPGQWCMPNFSDVVSGAGLCTATGTVAAGQACGPNQTCGAHLLCIQLSEKIARCQPLCIASKTGQLGPTCGASSACEAIAPSSSPVSLGVCHDTCDFDGPGVCPVSGDTCVPLEMQSPPPSQDPCIPGLAALPLGADCKQAGLQAYANCGGLALCVPDGKLLPCVGLCRLVKGAVGTKKHPDCPGAQPVCQALGASTTLGVCGS